jgi:hypothetical protein
MAIQHSNIPDAQLHEPKGVASAALNTSYFADGSGSGDWKKVGVETLSGLAGDGSVARLKVVTDGANGFDLYRDYAFGKMHITNNSAPFALTAAADTTLNTASQYTLLTGSGAPFANGLEDGVTFSVNKLTVAYAGVYDVNFWACITGFPTNTAHIAVRFRINGSTFSDQKVVNKSNGAGDDGIMSSCDLVQLAANDYIQLYIASSATGNVTINNSALTMKMIKAL